MVRVVNTFPRAQQLPLASVCCLLAIALTACAISPETKRPETIDLKAPQHLGEVKKLPRKQDFLVLKQTISGGQLVARLDANGVPLAGATAGFSALVYPSAIAVHGADLYIADSGARKLYRYDTDMQIMSVVPGEDAWPWTQMQVGADRSLFVLDSARAVIRHYPLSEQQPRTLGDPLVAASLDGFVVDEQLGGIVASDNLNHRLLTFNPLGGAGWSIGQAAELPSLGAMASDGHSVYAIDNDCACIVAMDEAGRVHGRIGRGELTQPRELAADRYGHIFVSDAATRTLKVFQRGKVVASFGTQALHCIEISALAVDEDTLYIADGPGAHVLAFLIQSPIEEWEAVGK